MIECKCGRPANAARGKCWSCYRDRNGNVIDRVRRKRGTGGINADGYMREPEKNGVREYTHRKIWKEHHGPIPAGYIVHHKDGNNTNNVIENLEVMTAADHRRLHINAGKH